MKRVLKTLSVASLFTFVSFVSAAVQAQQVPEVNYDLPTAEEVQAAKDSRRSYTVSDRTGRRILAAFELFEEDDIQGAIAELSDFSPSSDFDRAYVNRYLGTFLANEDRTDEALELVTEAADLDVLSHSDQTATLRLAADLNLQAENYAEAIRYYARLLQFSGEHDANVYLRIANAYYELEAFDKIIRPADLAIEHFEEPNKNPYVLKVASYYEREMFGEAVKTLESGLAVLPAESDWWIQLGNFYMLEERIDKALETMEIAYLAGYFESENHYRALVQMYANNEIPFKAGRTMARYIESGDVELTEINARAAASNFDAAREFDSAAQWYGIAAEQADSDTQKADRYRRQGVAYLRIQDYDNAVEAFERSVALDDEDAGSIFMSIAEAHYYSGRYREALAAAQRATDYPSQRRSARSWVGYIRATAERKGISI